LHAPDETDDAAVVAAIGVRSGLAFGRRRPVLDRRRCVDSLEQRRRIHAEEQRCDEDHDADPASTDEERPAHTATVFDL
jgi:hypothetical protein